MPEITSLRLRGMRLRNFKGIRDLHVDAKLGNLAIYGQNGLGKSTFADAYSWGLFGKDSRNQADFGIKTLDEHGQEIHHLDHEVEIDLDLNGSRLTLKRVYRETWERKRGNEAEEMTGHETKFFINGVQTNKADYQARVAGICPEKTFRLLTDPGLFSDEKAFPWANRREMLVDLAGDITDDDVIASKAELAKLPELLEGRSIDEQRKVLDARRKQVSEQIKLIPVRIDEANRSLEMLPETDADQTILAKLREELEELKIHRGQIQNGGHKVEFKRRRAELDTALIEIKNAAMSQTNPARQAAIAARREKDEAIASAQIKADEYGARLRSTINERDELQRKRDRFIARHREEKAKEYQGNDCCPTCGTAIPPEKIADAIEAFKLAKAKTLEGIVQDGKPIKAQWEAAVAKIAELEADQAEALEAVRVLKEERDAIVIPAETQVDPESLPEYQAKLAERDEIDRRIAALQTDEASALAGVEEAIAALLPKIRDLEQKALAFANRKPTEQRIADLAAEQRALGQEITRIEGTLFLIESFIRAKVDLLTGRINSKFSIARWKLFDEQLNGGLKECCEVMAAREEGQPLVPFSDLNTGMRINVGLDIIEAFAAHHGFAAPIFIDGAESVTRLLPTRGQQIRLIHSVADTALRFELDPLGIPEPAQTKTEKVPSTPPADLQEALL